MVLLDTANDKAQGVCGPGAEKSVQVFIPVSSPPADSLGFFTSVGGTVEADGGSVSIYGFTVMAGCNSHTTMRRAEGASRGLLNLVAERIRGTGVAHSLSTLLLGVGGALRWQ